MSVCIYISLRISRKKFYKRKRRCHYNTNKKKIECCKNDCISVKKYKIKRETNLVRNVEMKALMMEVIWKNETFTEFNRSKQSWFRSFFFLSFSLFFYPRENNTHNHRKWERESPSTFIVKREIYSNFLVGFYLNYFIFVERGQN